MTRSLVLGNGRFFLNFDEHYWIRDVFFPRIGIENHSEGHPFRMGVFVDGATHWIDSAWDRRIGYEPGALVGRTTLRHPGLGLELMLRDAVDFELDIYCREIGVRDLAGRARDVRIFLHHDFYISGTEVGDTALYDPDIGSLIHYKRDRYFLIGGGSPPTYRLDSFATGKKKVAGAEGTWRDAEGDGRLSEHPIVQGSVDSTLSLDVHVPAMGDATTYYWIGAGERYGELLRIDERVRRHGPRAFIDRTRAYWQLWLESPDQEFHALPDELHSLYRTSLLVMRAHVDHGGAIIAATDSDITHFARDTYAYMWPRDGALIANTFDRAGHANVSRRFFAFASALIKKEGYFLHKYHPDRSLASSWHPWLGERGERTLPIQEDETALVVWALWRHYERWRDVEFVQPMYRPFVVRAARFMEEYRDHATGLPLPSWDLWEERRGVLTFTCASVWAGLDAAARFADAFGDADVSTTCARAAAEVRAGVLEHLWDPAAGRFLRMLVPADMRRDGEALRDATPDASLFMLHVLGFLDEDDPRLVATLEAVTDALRVDTEIGGVARYRGDYYHAVSNDWEHVPGNPWFIAQCWLARWRIARAETPEELVAALGPLEWVARRATPSGLLPEQVHPYTGAPLSVTPLAWSHAAFVSAVHDYLDRRDRIAACRTCGAPPSQARMSSMERALR
jgi:GH15 family glucan-1,4-alpha-glucosidase